MSAPPPSVPSTCALLGGSKTSPTFVFGSWERRSGLRSAIATKAKRIASPPTACGRARTSRRRASPGPAGRPRQPSGSPSRSRHHPRVELEVKEVGDEVEEDHGEGEEQERSLQNRVVALVDGLDDGEPDTRVGEDVFDGDRPADDEAQRERDERHDGQQGVAK